MAGEHAFATSAAIEADAPDDERGWPGRTAAWFALAMIVLATALNFLGTTVFGLLIERIKIDLMLSDEQVGWLVGPANIMFYVLIGIPLARLVDIYPRKRVLAAGLVFASAATAMGGLMRGFGGLFASRMLVGAGSAAHAPGCYSLMSDFFSPRLMPRAIAIFQLGFIGGTTLGMFIGGHLLALALSWGPTRWLGMTIQAWQWVMLMVAVPGLLVAIGLMAMVEPPRRGVANQGKAPPLSGVLAFIWQRRRVYLPLFLGVMFCAIESISLQMWRTPFMIRTYHWNEIEIGNLMSPLLFATSLAGIYLGTALTEWLGRRHKDAHVRAMAILFALAAPCAIAYPLMPDGVSALVMMALSGMFGLALAVPQNAAIQLVTPNEMRGQVTAIYVFIFTLSGALGSLGIALVTRHIVGNEADLWQALSITAVLLVPIAAISAMKGMRPYRAEVERLSQIASPSLTNA